ncbi:MAG: hypothetical protein CMI13_00585 [Oleibacter sp.]|nr:hypothetical protein [Thalassolituus sp.]|tara:strand:+ start:560 stop:1246 length:687 start_codon:yes stop_codon:yes gene_type:complete
MQDFDTTSTQSLIDRYYEEEKAQREIEQTLAALTMRLDANDLAMLNVIARRFRKTRDEVAQEVLSNALIDLFARLDAGERKLIARDADDAARKLADEIAEENGVANVEVKAGVWANHDRQITKLERKKAKMLEQQQAAQKAAAKAPVTQEDDSSDYDDSDDADDDNSYDTDISADSTDSELQQSEQAANSESDEMTATDEQAEDDSAAAPEESSTEHKEDAKVSMFGS